MAFFFRAPKSLTAINTCLDEMEEFYFIYTFTYLKEFQLAKANDTRLNIVQRLLINKC